MKKLIILLIAATVALTGCSSATEEQGTLNPIMKGEVSENAGEGVYECDICNTKAGAYTIEEYPEYEDIKAGHYHEDCYYKILEELYPEDIDNNGYTAVVCPNCTDRGLLTVNKWIAYNHREPNCEVCGAELEIQNFATYQDFLTRGDKQKVETVTETDTKVEEPQYDTCAFCGAKGSQYPIEWYDGNGLVESGYYHGVCYSNLIEKYNNNSNNNNPDLGTIYCPSCGYETGEYGQQYLYNHGGDTSCPQCGNTMRQH